ncbi:hypothetical protein HPP92_000638 [Vanilla planifolia]|uniref:Peptidase M14 domain-containing protein n=1 Tax=Vanilla planifolia TaxID=51239 RepID=A0A835S2K2_VANPL|nr:hypothetical protein HPP92_000638 [Vanilla planifolia]
MPRANVDCQQCSSSHSPSMNPDGFAMRRRGNANNVDLNRDFPDQFYPMNDVMGFLTTETKAIMRWMEERHFTASASLHGGALVANYPWDGALDGRKEYFACPDDKTFSYMASILFYGGMQDWNYINRGCFELTLEISDEKWPKAVELQTLFEHNRMSMLNLVASVVKTGIHGKIFSLDNGGPLPASVMIKGIDYVVNASMTFGDYHRILVPGESYEVTASIAGYKSKTTKIFLEHEPVSLDFILDPEEGYTSQMGQIRCDHKFGFLGTNIYFLPVILLFILLFLCFMLKRNAIKFVKQRQSHGQKRASVV